MKTKNLSVALLLLISIYTAAVFAVSAEIQLSCEAIFLDKVDQRLTVDFDDQNDASFLNIVFNFNRYSLTSLLESSIDFLIDHNNAYAIRAPPVFLI